MDFVGALQPATAALEQLGIPYFIGGSVASSAYGAVRATLDIDVVAWFPVTAATPFAAAIHGQYYVDAEAIRDAARRYRSFNLVHFATALKIDVFCAQARPYDAAAFGRSARLPLDPDKPAATFPFAAPEDVILGKLQWYELGHRQAKQQMRDVKGMVRVQTALDLVYLRRWAAALLVGDLLEEALQP